MEKGTRFRLLSVDPEDRERDVAIGATGVLLEDSGPSGLPWCRMDKAWPGLGDARGRCEHGHGVVLALRQIEALPEAPAKPKSPRKAPKLQETSLQAHRSQEDKAPTDCMVVYNRLRKYPRGATCDRLEQALGMSHQTTSARLNDLARRGKILDSGRREKTRTGRPAICWKIVP